MFGTEMHLITFVILIFQVLVLFAQLLFYFSRPEDTSRLRFLTLIIIYIIHNLLAGLLPDKRIVLSIYIQNILAYTSGIVACIYLIHYVFKEFKIFSFSFIDVKSLCYTMTGSFVMLFIIPYCVTGRLKLAKTLFLSVSIILSLIFFVHLGSALAKIYKYQNRETKYFKYKIIGGYLGLFSIPIMIIVVALGDFQTIQQSVMNFGLTIMIASYIIDFISQRQEEFLLLKQMENKTTIHKINIASGIVDDILFKLQNFEQDHHYLTKKITLSLLAERFGTNSRYISEVVNTHKHKTFTQYINDLRVSYAKEKLATDEQFREYTIKAIANELGYMTPKAFAKAFLRKEHISASEYIKKIKK
uniref:helix-turn-helix domain-containing protein n=1 Tax=Aquimarina longa TaxID=1080221 RepID=UPI0007867BAE